MKLKKPRVTALGKDLLNVDKKDLVSLMATMMFTTIKDDNFTYKSLDEKFTESIQLAEILYNKVKATIK